MISQNPCEYVRKTCEKVMSKSTHVKIDPVALQKFCELLKKEQAISTFASWAACHYPPEKYSMEILLRYIFIIDTLNYCFWPNAPFEYDNLAGNLYDTLVKKPEFFELENLCKISESDLIKQVFKCEFCILEERVRMIQEVFTIIRDNFNGKCTSFVLLAHKNAILLVKLIVDSFPCFRDQAIYNKTGSQVFLYKRAQILVSDLYLAHRDLVKANPAFPNADLIDFEGSISELTTFADYRVPQVLRAKGVFVYDKMLAEKIDKKEIIDHSSDFEIEIRAGTVVAVEMMKKELLKLGVKAHSIEIDVCLWQIGEKIKSEIKDHHRTLSIFY